MTTLRPHAPPNMSGAGWQQELTEAELQTNVVALAKLCGLRTFHVTNMRRSAPGWPDLVIVGPGGILYRELKATKGRTTTEQDQWIAALQRAGADVAVWRPEDWRTGRIRDQLGALRSAP